ncbi:zinc finger CCHC domain-containing protein 7 [Hemibagrus wyckioides]|uniref:zinc finger CCHC domain-containing protein 7 n=1 Tax=Hemibagrus wyckioides TaxID=337641 RepID=UPI00266D63B0|nr:zinc finger CCHC domain-containing protein 7 [Hemibagrus wyckioides]
MFSGYQEREEYEDELYAEEEHADVSEPDSDLEFQLYSQLHYCTENPEENQTSSGHETPQEPQPGRRVQPPAAPPDEVILIDSGPDVITLSDNTEEEDSVCARKGQRSKGKGVALVSQPQHLRESEAVRDEVVVLDSESDSESIPPYVVDPDLDSDSDSDGLESWMILGREKEEGDQDIQLNVLAVRNREHSEFTSVGGDEQNWAVSDKDKEAQIFNKSRGSRRVSNRYYTEKTVTCRSCNKLGHLSKNCPTPKKAPCCLLCGLQGHLMKTCPNRHCSNCALPGHLYDDCLERAYWHKRCHRCAMTGHFADACPDIWRQYHLTTKPGPPLQPLHPDTHRSPAYCYNCSRMGHFGHECTERRMFNGTYPTLPFSSSYDTEHDIRRREHRARLQANELRDAGLLGEADFTPTPQPPRKKAKDTHFPKVPHTPTGAHIPKRRIAHTPKHPPQTTPKPNTHLRWHEDTPGPKNKKKKKNMNTPGPYSAATPRFEGKKKNKNKKQHPNEEGDFPRSFPNSPCNKGALFHTPPYRWRKNPGVLFSSEKSKKKKNKEEKRARKAARDPENLFLIKQRKRSR